jgi:hypothetical protein
MEKINSSTGLRNAITELETRQANQDKLMRQQFSTAYESIKPVNLIKATLTDIGHSEDVKDKLIHTSAGIVAGFLFEKIYVGNSESVGKKLMGAALTYGVSNAVANNPEVVIALAKGAFKLIQKAVDSYPPKGK